ncbi:CitMHS family transporter [Luteimonas abyssi]|uniref:CitMHS family transporter n=1 Tax=Luteimonas abyssi TaxID=1247514 RepID=UPI000737CDAE|nr:citrate:proton symporter [Luteimonas abyssi]
MLTLIGLLTIVCLVALLLGGRVAPVVALVLVPVAGALVAGFGPAEITEFFGSGLARVTPIAAMFIFAILFFGVLQDTGLFRPIINGLVAATRGNVVAVTVMTAVLGMVAQLDGAGATTFLLTVPALLPLYRELKMSPYLMLLLLALGAGIFNMLPWAGPLGRAAAVTGLDVTDLWRPLIPVQAAGAVLLVALAAGLGLRERRRIATGHGWTPAPGSMADTFTGLGDDDAEARALRRPGRIWINAILFVTVLAVLVAGVLPAALAFMIGLSLALVINYPDGKAQMARISAHAASALKMGSIILAAGAFLGIVDGSGMLRAIAQSLATVLPDAMLPMLHIILGVLGLPMELLLSTDAYYFGLLPVALEIVTPLGVDPASTVYALVIGNIIGTFISPFSPALWLALGLAGLEMGRHIRYAFWWMWAFSLAMLGVGWALGLF